MTTATRTTAKASEKTTPHSAPTAPTNAPAKQRSCELAEIFAREPELISACLQGIEDEPPGRLRLLLSSVREALRRYPNYADLYYHAGRAALAAGELDQAREFLDRALSIHPGYKDALLLAARVALLSGRPEQTEQLLQRALALGADYPDLHMLRGDAWRRMGDPERARCCYRRALELNGALQAARVALAELAGCEASGKRQ